MLKIAKTFTAMVIFVILVYYPRPNYALLQRCYSCRSRGELGSCKDPFVYNENERGVVTIPCASGWCGKMLETENAQKEEYGTAIQRRCLQRAPSDNEERCAYTKVDNRQMFMCFCKGDLCNNSNVPPSSVLLISLSLLIYTLISLV